MTAVAERRHVVQADRADHPADPDDTRVAAFSGAYWRELLISRWQAELAQVTELSLAFQQAADAAGAGAGPVEEGTSGGWNGGRWPPAARWPTPRRRSGGYQLAATAGASSALQTSRPTGSCAARKLATARAVRPARRRPRES